MSSGPNYISRPFIICICAYTRVAYIYSYDRHNVSVKYLLLYVTTVSQRMDCIYSLWLDASVKQMAVSDLNLYFKNKRLLAATTTTTTTTITDAASIRVR